MKVTKICPKCQSTEIYTNEGLVSRGERSIIAIAGWTNIYIVVYMCFSCGYFEEYVDENHLAKQKVREVISKTWTKL